MTSTEVNPQPKKEGTGTRRKKAPASGRRSNGSPSPLVAPVDRIEIWHLKDLVPYARNAKTHPPEQVALLAQSLKTYGQTKNIIVDGDRGKTYGELIAGHGTVLAAASLAWTSVKVGVAVGWTAEMKRAYRLVDNELGSERLAPYDPPLLRIELQQLKLDGFDLSSLGFQEPRLVAFLADPRGPLDPEQEWAGMPEFEQPDAKAFKSIVVHFRDQAAVDEFAKVTKQKVGEKTKFLWYPEIEIVPFVKVAGRASAKRRKKKAKRS